MGKRSQEFDEIQNWWDALQQTASPQDLVQTIGKRIEQETDPIRLDILNSFLAHEYHKQGNDAAFAAITAKDPRKQVDDWYFGWRRENRGKSCILILERRLRTETHPVKIEVLRRHLASEYVQSGLYASSTEIHLADFEADPDDALPLHRVAFQKLEFEDEPQEAMQFANRALEVAVRTGNFQRYVLGTKARIALRLQDYRVMEDVLCQIMRTKLTHSNADLGIERDFFDSLPPGSIDPEVARQYDEFCRARGKAAGADGDGSELPEWDDHENSDPGRRTDLDQPDPSRS